MHGRPCFPRTPTAYSLVSFPFGVGQGSGVDEVAVGDAFRYDDVVITLAAGLGVIGRSQRSAHA